MKPDEVFEIFGGRLEVMMSGRANGDCQISMPADPAILAFDEKNVNGGLAMAVVKPHVSRLALINIKKACGVLGTRRVIIPRANFSKRVARLSDSDIIELDDIVVRTEKPADGVIIGRAEKNSLAAGMLNADCHVGILYDERTERWAMVHLGLDCLVPKVGQNLIEVAIRALEARPDELLVWFGGGARGCCYGFYDHNNKLDQIRVLWPRYPFVDRVKREPRRGQVAVDNLLLCWELATQAGISPKRITVDSACTSCTSQMDGFYSHLRDRNELGARNCLMAIAR